MDEQELSEPVAGLTIALRDIQQQALANERVKSRAPSVVVIEAGATRANAPESCGYYPGMDQIETRR